MSETGSVQTRRLAGRVSRTTARFLAASDGVRRRSLIEVAATRLPWYEVRNQDGGPDAEDPATVLIYDEIGGSFGVDAKDFAEQLDAVTAPVIHVRINSPGGALFDAIAIHSTLLRHPARVVVYVDSLAASAASVIAMAGDELVMMPGSQMMIHDASMLVDGDAAEMASASTFLDRQSDNVAAMYQRRGGGEAGEWRELMLAETWMFAAEAVEMGLADRVETDREPAGDELLTRSFDLSQFRYRYADRAEAPAPRRRSGAITRPRTEARKSTSSSGATVMSASVQAIREAAAARRGAAGRGQMQRSATPCGRARSVSTAWMRHGLDSAMPRRLSARQAERDGKPFVVVEGYATVYERPYEMWDEHGPYQERVSAGAAEETLALNPDVIFLVNHRGLAMARTHQAGTLELWSDQVGMGDRAWLNPARQDVQDLVHGIDDEVITEQSFAFMITRGRWNDDFTEYRIDAFDINRGDTSAVNFGANPSTSIAARSREILDALELMPAGAARAALERLNRRADLVPVTPAPVSAPEPDPATRLAAFAPPKRRCATVSEVDAWLATRAGASR